jgi:hypothetical protein
MNSRFALVLLRGALLVSALIPAWGQTPSWLGTVWRVRETDGSGTRYCDATWTRQGNSLVFNGSWVCSWGLRLNDTLEVQPIQGNRIVVFRRGVNNRYEGTLSADRRTITGEPKWGAGTWKVTIEGSEAARVQVSQKPAIPVGSNAWIGQTWKVRETDGTAARYCDAIWRRQADSMKFSGAWVCSWGPRLEDDLQIESIDGSRIVVYRRGVNSRYEGALSADRRTISGVPKWGPGTWTVTIQDGDEGGDPKPPDFSGGIDGSWNQGTLHIWQQGEQLLVTAYWRMEGTRKMFKADGRIQGSEVTFQNLVMSPQMYGATPGRIEYFLRVSRDGQEMNGYWTIDGQRSNDQLRYVKDP